MMLAGPSAADRQVLLCCLGAEKRQRHRQTEDQHQRYGQDAPHTAIVALFGKMGRTA